MYGVSGIEAASLPSKHGTRVRFPADATFLVFFFCKIFCTLALLLIMLLAVAVALPVLLPLYHRREEVAHVVGIEVGGKSLNGAGPRGSKEGAVASYDGQRLRGRGLELLKSSIEHHLVGAIVEEVDNVAYLSKRASVVDGWGQGALSNIKAEHFGQGVIPQQVGPYICFPQRL